MNDEKIYIIILNYNGWKDTIECLESVLKLEYNNFQVIVCDNNSSNDSWNKIIDWAEGKERVLESKKEEYVFPLEKKPLSYAIINKDTLEQKNEKILLLQTENNGGFAFGNNCGIKYAIKQNDYRYIWFLNNDTVVDKKALINLKQYVERKENIGICGSKLIYYSNEDKIQGLAGKYNPITGYTQHIMEEKDLYKMSYVIGASMLVSKDFIKKVGLMNEVYFLYYEEIDWIERGKNLFKIDVCLDSVVYHKEGASIGEISAFSAYYLFRNVLLFTWYYYKKFFIIVFFIIFLKIFNPLKKRPYKRFNMLKRVIKGFYRNKNIRFL